MTDLTQSNPTGPTPKLTLPNRILKITVLGSAIALIAATTFLGCKSSEKPSSESATTTQSTSAANGGAASTQTQPVTSLKIEDIKVGTGAEATPGKTVTVNYTGWLTNGQKFDSSLDRNQPFKFHLGAGQVIRGWDQGVAGMKVGGKRKLTIPPQLAYGDRGVGPIPANSTLVFEVDLLGVD